MNWLNLAEGAASMRRIAKRTALQAQQPRAARTPREARQHRPQLGGAPRGPRRERRLQARGADAHGANVDRRRQRLNVARLRCQLR